MRISLIPLPSTPMPQAPESPTVLQTIEQIGPYVTKLGTWTKELTRWHDTAYAVMKQNTDRLSQTVLADTQTTDLSSWRFAGLGLAEDALRGYPLSLSSARVMQGLQLANGSDRGKVTVTFQYLGVGPVVVGSGANVTYTADLAVAGVNGLDTGSEAANTWYAVYVIVGDDGPVVNDTTANNNQPPLIRRGSRVAALLSTSATAPTLPSGYNRFRRAGWVRNNGTSDLYRFLHAVDDQWVWWNEDLTTADFRVLSVTTSSITFADVSCAKTVPPTSRMLYLNAWITDAAGQAYLNVKNKDAANVGYAAAGGGLGNVTATDEAQGRFLVGCDSSQVIQYRTNATTVDARLDVIGYQDIR